MCVALAWLPAPASAQATVQETQVKAAYLSKFASYAEWPEARLGEDASPLVIGVVGADALAGELEAQTRGQSVRGHPITVRRLAADGPLTEAHVLFVGPTDAPTLDAMFERLRGQPVLTVADVDTGRAKALAAEIGGEAVAPEAIMTTPCDVFSPNALGAILDEQGVAGLDCAIVAGGANNQLARPEHGAMLAEREILYAPDYVINAGGIINVSLEYLCRQHGEPCDVREVRERIGRIPERLEAIWRESDAGGEPPDRVADRMAQALIGRG